MYVHRLVDMEGRRAVWPLMGRYWGAQGRARALASGKAYVLIDGQPHLNGQPFTGRIETAFGAVAHYMDGHLVGRYQTIRSLLAHTQGPVPMPVLPVHEGTRRVADAPSPLEWAKSRREDAGAAG